MFIDLHVHTNRYSTCSILSPEEMLKVANLLKLDGLVIVEHGVIWDKSEVAALKQHPEAGNLIVLRGQEIRTYHNGRLEGDILVFGIERSIDRQLSAAELIKEVHGKGGVTIAAHPYRWAFGLGDKVQKLDLDAIEILNSNTTPDEMQKAQKAQETLHLAGTGGSDAHSADAVGNYLTWFDDQITTEVQLVEAIRQKRCRPAHYEELSLTL